MNIVIPKNSPDLGKRLDLYLSLQLPQFSRSFIKKTIETNQVKLNGEMFYKAGYKVKEDDVIEFPDVVEKRDSQILEPSPFDLEIIKEDEDYLFINKPAGLLVHPANQHQKDTLVNKLLSLKSDLPSNGINRPGIVHRLDRDTSGLIVIAKTPKALWWLSGQFADRKVHKKYTAISIAWENNFTENQEIEVEGFMRRASTDRKEYILEPIEKHHDKSRFSSTHVKIEKVGEIASNKIALIIAEPKTGRTHQIRVHLKSIGAPILHDELYLSRKQADWSEDLFKKHPELKKRLYLHSTSISFENYDGKMYFVETQLPEEFTKFINYASRSEKDNETNFSNQN